MYQFYCIDVSTLSESMVSNSSKQHTIAINGGCCDDSHKNSMV